MNLQAFDEAVLQSINGTHNAALDFVAQTLSFPWTLAPVIFLFLLWLYRLRGPSALALLVVLAIAVGLSDLIASGILKPLVARLRPCHEAGLGFVVYTPSGCGGKFGFASSHAANSFALATAFALFVRRRPIVTAAVLSYASLVALSRIYLGVHYLSDVVVGAAIGVIVAVAVFAVARAICDRHGWALALADD